MLKRNWRISEDGKTARDSYKVDVIHLSEHTLIIREAGGSTWTSIMSGHSYYPTEYNLFSGQFHAEGRVFTSMKSIRREKPGAKWKAAVRELIEHADRLEEENYHLALEWEVAEEKIKDENERRSFEWLERRREEEVAAVATDPRFQEVYAELVNRLGPASGLSVTVMQNAARRFHSELTQESK